VRSPSRVHGERWALLAAALVVAACSPSTTGAERLEWTRCGDSVDLAALDVPSERAAELDLGCATLTVPLDRTGTDPGEVAMALVKVHRKGAPTRPPLLFISGGPGQSGVDNAAALAGWLPGGVLDGFDVIGFDPRGIARSGQIDCAGRQRERPILDLSTDSGYAAGVAAARAFADECRKRLGAAARHYSTTATAEDIEAIRVALGADALRSVGWSYGATLGAEYARLHPDRVEAAVLDAPTDPTVPWIDMINGQVMGFERSFGRFVAWCRGRPECAPLGDVRAFVAALVRQASKAPLPSQRREDRTPTTADDVVRGVVTALYDDGRWPELASVLDESAHGDSGGLRALAEGGGYTRPELDEPEDLRSQAQYVINCNDTGRDPTETEVRAAAARMVVDAPVFGAWGSFNLLGCGYWKVPRTALGVPSAATRSPVLVVGTRGDPATPYTGAQTMARVLGNAVLLTWEGEGHTAFGRSPCIGEHVVRYLVDLTVPPPGTSCPATA
jgi:pimeloyl-ACP methyl ester carboxylesterase